MKSCPLLKLMIRLKPQWPGSKASRVPARNGLAQNLNPEAERPQFGPLSLTKGKIRTALKPLKRLTKSKRITQTRVYEAYLQKVEQEVEVQPEVATRSVKKF